MQLYTEYLKNNNGNLLTQFHKLEQDSTDKNYFYAKSYPEKNNFPNILASERSRVKLEDCKCDYINANYILENYIATQQPNEHTINDFWKMIYQTNTSIIINLTGDNNYLSTDNIFTIYGDISLKLRQIKSNEYMSILRITLTQNKIKRKLYHITYHNWPDFGIPDVDEFMSLLNEINFLNTDDNRPITIHCKAGVGRTGTFIMIHHILEGIKQNNYYDPIKVIQKMRESRASMIQNKTQFEFAISIILKQSL